MVQLKLVEATVAGAPGPEGQPYLNTLSCPVYDSLTKLAAVIEGEEEASARIVECAQRAWAKADGWYAHAAARGPPVQRGASRGHLEPVGFSAPGYRYDRYGPGLPLRPLRPRVDPSSLR